MCIWACQHRTSSPSPWGVSGDSPLSCRSRGACDRVSSRCGQRLNATVVVKWARREPTRQGSSKWPQDHMQWISSWLSWWMSCGLLNTPHSLSQCCDVFLVNVDKSVPVLNLIICGVDEDFTACLCLTRSRSHNLEGIFLTENKRDLKVWAENRMHLWWAHWWRDFQQRSQHSLPLKYVSFYSID